MEQKKQVEKRRSGLDETNLHSEILKHYLVYGKAGAGKTSFIMGILEAAFEKGFGVESKNCLTPVNGYRVVGDEICFKIREAVQNIVDGKRRGQGDISCVLIKDEIRIAVFTWGDETRNLQDARDFAIVNHCSTLVSAYRNGPRFRKKLLCIKDHIKLVRLFSDTRISREFFREISKDMLKDIIDGL